MTKAAQTNGQIKVTQIKSTIGEPEKIRATIKALGLGKLRKTTLIKDNNCMRGMLNQVKHLVKYEL